MKIVNNLLAAIAVIIMLGSCVGPEQALEGEIVEKESLVDKKQVVREGKKKIRETSKYGPKIVDIENTELRKETTTLIDKEDAPSYVNLLDDGSGNIFPIDINMENVDIRTFTQMLSKITGVNFLVSEEVGGYVSAKLQDVMWPNALDSVLSLKSLAKHVDNKSNIIRIHSQERIVQLETFERQRMEDLQRLAMLDRANEPLFTQIFKLFYTRPDVVSTILGSVLGVSGESGGDGGLRNTQPQITVDERLNQLIVKAREEDIETITKLIEKVDTRTKQVFIEAFIVEVTDEFEKALGTRMGANLATSNNIDSFSGQKDKTFNVSTTGLGGNPANPLSAGTSDSSNVDLGLASATSSIAFLLGLGDAADLKLELTAMEAIGVSKVISNPKIFTLDNQEAVIFQGDEIPYETVSSEGTQIQFKEAGLRLAVTPTVVGDGNIIMDIAVNKDTADTSQANPPITSSEITTNLVTRDGSIVVIGGIYTQNEADSTEKVPFLGDIPGAGKLFRRESRQDDKQELMIFIAPKVL